MKESLANLGLVAKIKEPESSDWMEALGKAFEKERLINRGARLEEIKIYVPKGLYERADMEMIHQKEQEYGCVLVPYDPEEEQVVFDDAVRYSKKPEPPYEMPELATPIMYDTPYVKGGRYHEPPRDLKKKKKAKRRQQHQARRKRK